MHAEGWGIRALSRHFNMGRNTIRRILRKNHEKRDIGHDVLAHQRPIVRKSKLDDFKPMIKALLEKYPDMTGVRVQETLSENGFDGGQSIVRDYLRKIRPRPKKEPVVRFETPPGHQGQMDWSPYTLSFTRSGRQKVLWFSYILGFSRRQYIDCTTARRFYTLIRRHQDAFAHFGGVPASCLYDGEKTVILRWEAGQPVYNPAFVAFITHYHCRPVACLPGRAQTKGKIEAPFQYIEKNLLNGRTFDDLSDLRQTAAWWLANRSDVPVHDTTGEKSPWNCFWRKSRCPPIPMTVPRWRCGSAGWTDFWNMRPTCIRCPMNTSPISSKLSRMEKALDETLAEATKKNLPAAAVLERLLEIEAVSLIERRMERRIRESKLPERKLLADFDFTFQTGVDKRQVMDLATLGFVQRKQWLILAGSSGAGKSHIAKALLLLACQHLYRCRYVTASFMLHDLWSGLAPTTAARTN